MEEIEEVDKKCINDEELKEIEEMNDINYKLNFKIKSLDETKLKLYTFQAICYSFYIVKEKDLDINWRKPLI